MGLQKPGKGHPREARKKNWSVYSAAWAVEETWGRKDLGSKRLRVEEKSKRLGDWGRRDLGSTRLGVEEIWGRRDLGSKTLGVEEIWRGRDSGSKGRGIWAELD